jgi:hypothetical protein
LSFHERKEGTEPLKIFPFLFFQISQAARENFHEEAQAEVLLGFLNGVKKEEAMIPGDSQIIPTFRAEGALED